MRRLYDPDLLKHSTPQEDLKWSAASLAVAGIFVLAIIALLASVLR